jgi:hypothetical protein
MTDFQKWLLRNQDRFKTYSLAEIAELAVACGFPREEIVQWTVQERWKEAV